MDPIDLLVKLFENVPDPATPVQRGLGRIGGVMTAPANSPVAAPLAWLTEYGVPTVQCANCDLPPGCAARFKLVPPQVLIPIRANFSAPFTLWCLWHEAAHAADLVPKPGQVRTGNLGHYSTKHRVILDEFAKVIVEWTPCPTDPKYKHHPTELWAEAMACAICDGPRVPTKLLDEIRPDLVGLGVPTC